MVSSPSQLLAFSRQTSQCASIRSATRSFAARPFSTSRPRLADGKETGDIGHNKRHVLDKAKDKEPNLQAYESNKGQESRIQGTGGTATEQGDSGKSVNKAKKEFPEAPDTIGFQDERGGKGHHK